MIVALRNSFLVSILTTLFLLTTAQAQFIQNSHATAVQSIATSLASLPEADTIIYSNPQKILNEVAPKVVAPKELEEMRAVFADLKKNVGIDPASVNYIAIAVRFHKPSAELNFVAPDLLAVFSGDFSADSLVTLAGVYLQDRTRTEQYGSKTLTIMKIDPIAEAAEKNPLLKSFVEVGLVPLNANTLAVGNISYLKAAVDAAAGNGRISTATVNSLLRDPDVLVSAAGSPLTAFAKSFGLLGTETSPRVPLCVTRFGDFYAAVTTSGSNFNFRGALNTDNPDTAKIINGLLSGVMQQIVDSVPDKQAQTVLKAIKMQPKENEIVWEGAVSEETVSAMIREQQKVTSAAPSTPTKPKPKTRPKRRVRHK